MPKQSFFDAYVTIKTWRNEIRQTKSSTLSPSLRLKRSKLLQALGEALETMKAWTGQLPRSEQIRDDPQSDTLPTKEEVILEMVRGAVAGNVHDAEALREWLDLKAAQRETVVGGYRAKAKAPQLARNEEIERLRAFLRVRGGLTVNQLRALLDAPNNATVEAWVSQAGDIQKIFTRKWGKRRAKTVFELKDK